MMVRREPWGKAHLGAPGRAGEIGKARLGAPGWADEIGKARLGAPGWAGATGQTRREDAERRARTSRQRIRVYSSNVHE